MGSSRSKKSKKYWIITEDKFLTEPEVRQLIGYLKLCGTSYRAKTNFFLVDLMLNTGLRAAEVCSLPITNTPAIRDRDIIHVVGKGRKPRQVSVTALFADRLRAYVADVRPRYLPDEDSPLLLYTEHRTPYSRRNLWKRIRGIGARAGLKLSLYPHRLRHTYATQLYWATNDILMIQAQLGHSSIDTSSVYAKIDDGAISRKLLDVGILNMEV